MKIQILGLIASIMLTNSALAEFKFRKTPKTEKILLIFNKTDKEILCTVNPKSDDQLKIKGKKQLLLKPKNGKIEIKEKDLSNLKFALDYFQRAEKYSQGVKKNATLTRSIQKFKGSPREISILNIRNDENGTIKLSNGSC